MKFFAINQIPKAELIAEFLRCCGSTRWAEQMATARPFLNQESLFMEASRIWKSLTPDDWLEAFSHHPKIGDKKGTNWSKEEQAKVQVATEEVLSQLSDGNLAYQQKFGFIFLVCATGKTADEMLALLQKRLKNSPNEELAIAAGEQDKITQIRLKKLLQS
jgi:2-oxo-4-hydroxy-4-carboxy-5-ureidoimidazoline decarboxylase